MKTFMTIVLLLVLLVGSAFAQTGTGKNTGPVTVLKEYTPCVPEDLVGEVTYHYQYRTDNPAHRVYLHWSSQGGELVGQTTGRVYRWNFQLLDNEQEWPIELSNGSWTAIYINRVNLVGTGKNAVNLSFNLFWHATILESGEVQVDILKFTDFCESL